MLVVPAAEVGHHPIASPHAAADDFFPERLRHGGTRQALQIHERAPPLHLGAAQQGLSLLRFSADVLSSSTQDWSVSRL